MLSISLSLFLGALILRSPIITRIYIIFLSIFIRLFITFIVSSWFAFLLFLLYVGGILVIFIYFSSLIPNQQINTRFMFFILILTILLNLLLPSTLLPMKIIQTTAQEPLFIISPLFSLVYISLVVFLFIVIVTVVKLTSKPQLPIRPLLYAQTRS